MNDFIDDKLLILIEVKVTRKKARNFESWVGFSNQYILYYKICKSPKLKYEMEEMAGIEAYLTVARHRPLPK